MITRRTFLGATSAVGSILIAGCTGDDNQDEEIDRFKTVLADNGVDVVEGSYDSSSNAVTLSYIPQGSDQDALADEIGQIMGSFFERVDNGWEARRLNGTILSSEEAPIADWFAEVDWYEQLQAGELTAGELSIRVLDTLSTAENG